MKHPYEDILHLPHHTSPTRPRMSAIDRAAQFSPFAALTGFEAAIAETGRLTDRPIELTDSAREALDESFIYCCGSRSWKGHLPISSRIFGRKAANTSPSPAA